MTDIEKEMEIEEIVIMDDLGMVDDMIYMGNEFPEDYADPEEYHDLLESGCDFPFHIVGPNFE